MIKATYRLVTSLYLILLLRKLKNSATHAGSVPDQKESYFIIMDMACQNLQQMVKSGYLTRSFHSDFPLFFYLIILLSSNNCAIVLQSYTQYIPLPVSDLDSWLKTPSIYVFDCSAAGRIVKAFHEVHKIWAK